MSEISDRIRADVAARRPVDAREQQAIADFERLIAGLDQPFSESANRVHVTGSAIVVTTDRRRVLLHLHKRMEKWLQPGGHIDEGELPWDGSLREVIEETGLAAALVLDGDGSPQLVHIDVHAGPRKHTHLDLRYLVEAPQVPPAPPEGESQEVRWFAWHQAIALAEPGLEGGLRALQPGEPVLRVVRNTDAKDCANVYLRSRAFGLPEVPFAHGDTDVRRWMADEVVGHTDMWVAELDGVIAGILVLSHDRDGSWIEHLYLDPSWVGRGLGDRFIEVAKRRCPDGVQLWAFQSNDRARRFYERHGFLAESFTDGAGNEERTPDVRYRWTP
jgi:8-oxo-dGTP pyrophosphatase MutT (NUDIX family)/GNAT superfamily N-acetyltransferase